MKISKLRVTLKDLELSDWLQVVINVSRGHREHSAIDWKLRNIISLERARFPLWRDFFFFFWALDMLSWAPFSRQDWMIVKPWQSQIFFPNKVTTLARNLTWVITPSLSPNNRPIQDFWAMDAWVCVISPRATEGKWCKPVGQYASQRWRGANLKVWSTTRTPARD